MLAKPSRKARMISTSGLAEISSERFGRRFCKVASPNSKPKGVTRDGALQRIDEALALAVETGEHWTDALLHPIRGDILLKRDPANPAPAEEAYRTAIAIAKEQKARSFEVQAALALAKVYRSAARLVDAHALLARALEGLSATPEMPEIAEAQAQFAALAETDEVKAQAGKRDQRLRLQGAHGVPPRRAWVRLRRGPGSKERPIPLAASLDRETGKA
jgi:hypothetical protein